MRAKRERNFWNERGPEYLTWVGLRQRCYNPNNTAYRNYGARGIRVCGRWRKSFKAFIADMGRRPSPKHSIDRKENDGDYTPKNCRWATKKQQMKNRRRYKRPNAWSKRRVFGHLRLLGRIKENNHSKMLCICTCGEIRSYHSWLLFAGIQRDCGHIHKAKIHARRLARIKRHKIL